MCNVNNSELFERTEILLGTQAMVRLSRTRVALFGVGGVGGYALEALVRSGIRDITVIDGDTVSKSNVNRQIIATSHTVGRPKVEVAKERAEQINPDVKITALNLFFSKENADSIDFSSYDYIIDAIDAVSSKIELIMRAKEAGVPIISSMGAGNKLDPTAFEVSDIYKTSVCPLARVMRRELKARGIDRLKVVYSTEAEITSGERDPESGKMSPGSLSFVPSVMGLIMAGEVIKDLIRN